MSDRSENYEQLTLPGMVSATSSPASAGGPVLCASPGSATTPTSGPSRVRASRSRSPAAAPASTTNATFGPSPSSSSPSAFLQSSLANRLRARLASRGSPLYALTWNELAMPSGPPILQRRASVRRTSGNACSSAQSGYPTPTANDATGSDYAYAGGDHAKIVLKLGGVAKLTGYPTPTARDWRDGRSTAAMASTASRPLNEVCVAAFAGYPTPRASDGAKGTCRETTPTTGPDLPTVTGWATPTANQPGETAAGHIERKRRARDAGASMGLSVTSLTHQAELVDPGATSNGSSAATARRAQLNPAFTLWLMGYPAAWACCAPQATRSSRRSRPSSSAPSSTP